MIVNDDKLVCLNIGIEDNGYIYVYNNCHEVRAMKEIEQIEFAQIY